MEEEDIFQNAVDRHIVMDNAIRTMIALNEFFVKPGTQESDKDKVMTFEQFMMIQSNIWRDTKQKFRI